MDKSDRDLERNTARDELDDLVAAIRALRDEWRARACRCYGHCDCVDGHFACANELDALLARLLGDPAQEQS